ncbi:MAG: winged helix-turn-helix domain-containing protein [Alphaproteobacteria bacterium]|nr:winged helix-turn-helix domain-containing protein [Alphaproteobacteria bacterium]
MLQLRACAVDPSSAVATFADGRLERLTPRELALLLYLAERHERVVPREELLEQVWGYAPSVVSRVVDTTVRRLREKIELDAQQPDHVMTSFGEGYRFVPATVETVVPTTLPPDADAEPFVGRAVELAALCGWLRQPGGVVTLIGPPGAGKTRIARRLPHELREWLPGGSWLVDVTEARDLPTVAHAVALALGVERPQVAAATLTRVGRVLHSFGPALLVLDNCEGAADAVGEVARRLLEAAPDLWVVTTSRQRIAHQDDARTLSVEPLPLPDAVRLFEVLAQRVRPGFTVTAELRPVVEELVERLERIPLAVALAAGRAGALSPRALLERLDDRFRLLRSQERDAHPRQRTLRATLDWSWELLTEGERETLTSCAAFRGGFDAEAARVVVGREDTDEQLASLCTRSLLERRNDRYGGYAFVREYASARLADQPAREAEVFVRHGRCMLGRASAFGRSGQERGRALSRDRGNLMVAAERATEAGQVDVAVGCTIAALDIIGREGPYELGVELVRGTLGLDGIPGEERALLLLRLAVLCQGTGQSDGEAELREGLEEARRVGSQRLIAEGLRSLSGVERARGRMGEALVLCEQALPLAREVDGGTLQSVLTSYAIVLRILGRMDEAYGIWQELEQRTRDPGLETVSNRTHVLGNLALLERRSGRLEEAEAHYREAVALTEALGDRRSEGLAHLGLGNLLLDQGRLDEARTAYAAGLRPAREVGELDTVARFHGNMALLERLSGRLDAAEEHTRIAIASFERLGEPTHASIARANLGVLLVQRGNVAEGVALIREGMDAMRASGEKAYEAELCTSLAHGLLLLGELAEARAVVDRAETLARAVRDPLALAATLARRGLVELAEGRDARATLADAESLAGDAKPSSDTGIALADLRAALLRQ